MSLGLAAVRGPRAGAMSLTPQNCPPVCLLLEPSGKENLGRAPDLGGESDFMAEDCGSAVGSLCH